MKQPSTALNPRHARQSLRWVRRLGMLTLLLHAFTAYAAPDAHANPIMVANDLETFVDGVMLDHFDRFELAGAAVTVVKDGDVILSKGYGYADIEQQVPVDPERTRFDIGSVTKLFTATAVMQLVEQGRIDLDADVNDYLTALQVPATFPEPITAAHLLTHTAGFADRHLLGMVAPSLAEVEPLGENLARNLPPRIRPPGGTHQYNNQGMGLAGHVVEAVSGRAFDDYLTTHILEPLGMTRTNFGQPVVLEFDDAVGYEGLFGPTAAVEPWIVNLRPAGGLWSTGQDMAAFMLAFLQGGEHGGSRILAAETVEEMHRTQFADHPDVSGIGYGFFEHRAGDRRGVQHGGGWAGFSSLLYLLPEADVGLFVAYNHGVGQEVGIALVRAVLDRYFPVPPFTGEPTAGAPERAVVYEGQYRWNRHDRYSFMRLISTLQIPTIQVRAEADGTLTATMSPALLPDSHWIETEKPGVFGEVGGANTLAFETDAGGHATHLVVAGAQLFVMDRLAWYETSAFHSWLLLFFLAALLIAAVGWPAGGLYRRLRRRRNQVPANLRLARHLGGLAGGLGLAFFLGLMVFFATNLSGLLQVSNGFKALLWLPLISAILTVALAVVLVRLWVGGEGTRAERLYHSGLALILMVFIPFMHHWRLLGFHY